MRIVGGSCRGMRLYTTLPGGHKPDIRPTSSRIRTAIFDSLTHSPHGDRIKGKAVLDLFAGTGAMGLEALSRGAARAVFIERDRKAAELVRRNIAQLRPDAPTRILRCDSRSLPRRLADHHDLVFVDPPYASDLAPIALQRAHRTGWIGPGSWVVVESRNETGNPAWVEWVTVRSFGSTVISIGRVTEQAEPSHEH
ncbi:MAG: 16S rRNA (guanine(966)-N(2))-methyltransferase RsmD [Rhodobacteraceae bacterium]|nr:16S rRNA (guanine(966)-N(2))-methyltransferase RsmD [Paracoccaceae bacterium]